MHILYFVSYEEQLMSRVFLIYMCVCVYVYVYVHTQSHCTVLSDWESICTVTGAKKGKKIRKNTFLPSVFKSVKLLQVFRTFSYSGP